jgi:nucleoside-diphosphate-sugar epimerase
LARVESITGDVADPLVWQRALRETDVVLHLAAQTSLRFSEENPEADFRINVASARHLFDSVRENSPTVVFASTSTVFGLPRSLPVSEDAPDDPLTVYDRHKKLAESILHALPRAISLRLTNVYGPGPSPKKHDRGIIDTMIRRALDGRPLEVFGAGTAVRDYLFIDDAVSAFLGATRAPDGTAGRAFVVGSGEGHSLRSAFELVAARVARRTGRSVDIVTVPPPPELHAIDSRSFVADHRRFSEFTGWQPTLSLEQGIDATLDDIESADTDSKSARVQSS